MSERKFYHSYLDLSDRDRVFIAGDIHGEFAMLETELSKVSFNPEKDALVLVGDLIDRGPDNDAALDWIKRPYVYRVLGNHDDAPWLFMNNHITGSEYSNWGGDWLLKRSGVEIEKFSDALIDCPLAMTITTPAGYKVGVTHANCLGDWNRQIEMTDDPNPRNKWVWDLTYCDREKIKYLLEAKKKDLPIDLDRIRVKNIDFVFHGHSVLARPLVVANCAWIDTGACYGGVLTVVNMDDWIKHHLP